MNCGTAGAEMTQWIRPTRLSHPRYLSRTRFDTSASLEVTSASHHFGRDDGSSRPAYRLNARMHRPRVLAGCVMTAPTLVVFDEASDTADVLAAVYERRGIAVQRRRPSLESGCGESWPSVVLTDDARKASASADSTRV